MITYHEEDMSSAATRELTSDDVEYDMWIVVSNATWDGPWYKIRARLHDDVAAVTSDTMMDYTHDSVWEVITDD